MIKKLVFIQMLIIGIIVSNGEVNQDGILVKHYSKVKNQGFFVFCDFHGEFIERITFSYTIDTEKDKFIIYLVQKELLPRSPLDRNYLRGFKESEDWNRSIKGTSTRSSFLVFDTHFFEWNNSEKLDFFTRFCIRSD
jgi:hypothetical protein